MVEQDRKDLNDRFIKVYRLLEQRKEIVNHHPTRSKSVLAERLLGSKQYGHIVSQFLSGKRHIAYKHARKMCQLYGVNPSYMMDGIGEPFDLFVAPQPQAVTDDANAILYTSMASIANAGIVMDTRDKKEEFSHFSLPNVNSRHLVAFDVEGESMEPIISKSDIVVCEPMTGLDGIKYGDIYAVKIDNRIWIKYLRKIKDQFGRVEQLELISANYLEHPPFTEDLKHKRIQLYKVIRKISKM